MNDSRRYTQREIAKLFRIPDYMLGLPSPWHRRLWQRYVTRRS